MISLLKNKYFHLYFFLILSLQYIFSLINFGEILVEPHDNLEITVVYDHIIGEIYKGNFESINNFLSGEIKWYYIEKIFYPFNIFHIFLSDKTFYFTEEILKKIITYFSFYILAKSLNHSKLNSALGGLMYTTIINIVPPYGFGISLMPYIFYLLINKNILSIKHYIAVFFICLNTSLAQDFFPLVILFFFSYFLMEKKKNFKVFFTLFFLIFFGVILSNIHLILISFSDLQMHREDVMMNNFYTSTFLSFKNLFLGLNINNPIFFFTVPQIILYLLLIIIGIKKQDRKINYLLYFIFLIVILRSIVSSNFMEFILIGPLEFLRGFNFGRIDRILPLVMTLLLITQLSQAKTVYLKKIIYTLSIFSIITLQLGTPLNESIKLILKNNMNEKSLKNLRTYFLNSNITESSKIIFNKDNYKKNLNDGLQYRTNKTFERYYQFEDYNYIKEIVQEKRLMSVGLDPMVAVMNDIKVIDGYHTIYPKNYKIKFRKIIEAELEKDKDLKNYYDTWGNRVYAFYSNKNNLLLNYQEVKKIGADYIIASFEINNNQLEMICSKCNKSSNLFLYKIL